MPVANVADLEVWLRRAIPNAEIPHAELMIAAACGQIVDYCGWAIAAETVTFTVDADGGSVLGLPTLHLTAVTAVTLLADPIHGAGATTVTDFTWSSAGYLHRGAEWPHRLRSVSAAVEHGYDPVPPELVVVACGMASRAMSTAGRGIVTTRSIGDYSDSVPTGNVLTGVAGGDQLVMSPLETGVLDKYTLSNRP